MKYILSIITVAAIVWAIVACEESLFTIGVDCEYCFPDKFDYADLEVQLSEDERIDNIYLEVYKGNVDRSQPLFADTVYDSNVYVWVKVNEKYSAKAIYQIGDKHLTAVNGTKIKRKYVSETCEYDCYYAFDYSIDNTIKYWP